MGTSTQTNIYMVIRFWSTQSAESWTLVNIYEPCHGEQRVNYTNWIFGLSIPHDKEWLLVGDYNIIRIPEIATNQGALF